MALLFFFVVKTKIGLGCPGWGHPISEKRIGGQECARTVGEPWERGKNRGRVQRTVGEPWGLYKEPWENRGDFTKNRGRTVGTLQRTVGEPWGLYKEPWENRGLYQEPWENRGRTVGIQVLPSNDLVVTKSENRVRTVGEPWGFSGEPWENRGDFPENRGRTVGILRRTVGEPWGFSGEAWENRGGTFENRGDPKWTPKPHAKKKKTVSAVVGALLTAVSFWPSLVARTVGEPWGPN